MEIVHQDSEQNRHVRVVTLSEVVEDEDYDPYEECYHDSTYSESVL